MAAATAPRVALVDDEESIREAVGYALRREGYRVEAHADGTSAWEAFRRDLPDVVILDILMPGLDGLELTRRLRAISERLPILFLSSRDEELDRVLGLELGADDYLCKPFSLRELMARVKVLLRRASREPLAAGQERVLVSGALRLDLERYEARWNEQPVPLTVTEFRLLQVLARRPGHVKSRANLMAEAYPDDTYVAERTVDSHVKRLRQKLDRASPGAGDALETVYGLGYRFHPR